MFRDGEDLRELTLLERKARLKEILPHHKLIAFSSHRKAEGTRFFAEAERKGLEGIMAKRSGSQYLSGARTDDWLKIKTSKRQEVAASPKPVIFAPGRGRPATKPERTGSPTATNTIEIVRVSRWNAAVAGLPRARITSGCRSTSSFANIRVRSKLSPAQRTSIFRLRPSVQPSCSTCMKPERWSFPFGGRAGLIFLDKFVGAGELHLRHRQPEVVVDPAVEHGAELRLERGRLHAHHGAADHLRLEADLVDGLHYADRIRRIGAHHHEIRIGGRNGAHDRAKSWSTADRSCRRRP
jgi:ATP dependent DNA ligase domain